MSRGALVSLAVCLVGIAPAARAQQAPAQPAPATTDSTRLSTVTYISGASVYVGAGRADGIREGTSLEVFRRGVVIATLRAVFLASHSTSGEIVSSTAPPAVGDSVRFHPVVEQTIAADSNGAEAPVRPRTPSWKRPVRGHVGLRYLSISQPNLEGGAASFNQPSADVHLDATSRGGTTVGFVLDGRSRRTIGTRETQASALDQRTLVYEASLSMSHEGSGTRLSVGRQYSAALSSVSLFDGVTAELTQPRWGMGLFTGMQPDVATMNYSSAIQEAGGYVQVHNTPDGTVPWSVTTGAVDSRDLGQINREYGFTQVTLSSRIVTLYATQEVDFNRGWKRTAGEAAVTPTSTFATLSIRPVDELSIQGGVDNRRNVRLYRDYISPETEFDDAFREGVWGGANLSLFHKIRIGGDARMSRGGVAGDAEYYTGSFGLGPLSPLGFDGRLRSTSFRTANSTGWLHSWSAGVDPFGVVRLEVNGGLRTQRLTVTPDTTTGLTPFIPLSNARWIGASADISLGRSWYVLASGTRDGSGAELTNQLYCSLVFRF